MHLHHRKRHRIIWIILGTGLPLLFVLSLWYRPDPVVYQADALPESEGDSVSQSKSPATLEF